MGAVLVLTEDVESVRVDHGLVVAVLRDGRERRRPIADLDCLVIDAWELLIPLSLLRTAAREGVAVLLTDRSRKPSALCLPLVGAAEHTARVHAQAAIARPRRKRAWQQIIRAKIEEQARVVEEDDPTLGARLRAMKGAVHSGDPSNREAVAARLYWSSGVHDGFHRSARAGDTLNSAHDYGYAIIRSKVAQAVVSHGLHPALGFHHHARSNPFCLADDLIEPIRPMLDVWLLRAPPELFKGSSELTSDDKRYLLGILVSVVRHGTEVGPLTTAIDIYAASTAQYFLEDTDRLVIPSSL